MLYRLVVAIVALAMWSSACEGEVATLEMTTATSLGPNASVFPSSTSIQLELLSPSVNTYTQLPNVLYSIVNGNNETSGVIDLNFNLIIGSETISKTAAHKYDVFSQISGPGAHGGTASMNLLSPTPIVFSSQMGVFTINYSTASANHLGRPPGWDGTVPLTVGLLFSPVPEPSGLVLLFSGLSILGSGRRRQ